MVVTAAFLAGPSHEPGGKIIRETGYYAEPFEPQEWRAKWAES